jgi:5'-nucleotidase
MKEMETNKKLILVTNDDSIYAKGIASLVEVAKQFGEVVVVAPDKPQSGMGHAITINHPLRLQEQNIFEGIKSFSCTGTPVDCVKLGIIEVLHRRPDLILSGINHGSNAATNVLYSGTMSAAVEGAMEGIPSIGFSFCDYEADADFTDAKSVAEKLIPQVLENGLPDNVCLNVNIPKVDQLKGIKVCSQAKAFWEDRFDKRQDQFGRDYFWLTGNFKEHVYSKESDLHFLEEGYATVVPTQFDLTAKHTLDLLKKIVENEN